MKSLHKISQRSFTQDDLIKLWWCTRDTTKVPHAAIIRNGIIYCEDLGSIEEWHQIWDFKGVENFWVRDGKPSPDYSKIIYEESA